MLQGAIPEVAKSGCSSNERGGRPCSIYSALQTVVQATLCTGQENTKIAPVTMSKELL